MTLRVCIKTSGTGFQPVDYHGQDAHATNQQIGFDTASKRTDGTTKTQTALPPTHWVDGSYSLCCLYDL